MSTAQDSYFPNDLLKILKIIKANNYQKIVVQLDKESTLIAMTFINDLKKNLLTDPNFDSSEIIILSDSLKNTCCDDNILADRVSGQFLIKIGASCNTKSFGQCKIDQQFHLDLKKTFNVPETAEFLGSEIFSLGNMNYYILIEEGYTHLREDLEENMIG
jgi:diphthamide biosynthesis enzyme Dph1/Dph2-like protein